MVDVAPTGPSVDDGTDDGHTDRTEPPESPGGSGSGRRRHRRAGSAGQRWTRWIHVYTSMISLLLVLFFGITGLTLNHPDWTFGDGMTETDVTGTLTGVTAADGSVDLLGVSEQLRAKYGISAAVSEHRVDGDQGAISYRGPGYAADVTFSIASGKYRLLIEEQGFVGVMNDLHKGRDADSSWKWVIDVSAGFLVLISLSGLLLQLYLRRRRRSALVVAGVGLVATVVLAVLTL